MTVTAAERLFTPIYHMPRRHWNSLVLLRLGQLMTSRSRVYVEPVMRSVLLYFL